MVGGGRADEPSGRNELVLAGDHFVDVVELVEVEEEPREVGDEEHANDEDQNESQLQVLACWLLPFFFLRL